MHKPTGAITLIVMLLLSMFVVAPAGAVQIGDPAFERTWERTDKPVADGRTVRTWHWGPEAFSSVMYEDYVESPDGKRKVQYFDKSRMEINDPGADPTSPWYVTNGLIVREMIEGYVQTGHGARDESLDPAIVNIAGDPGERPTYADIWNYGLLHAPARQVGSTITSVLYPDGRIFYEVEAANYLLTASHYIPETNHTVADVFFDYLNSQAMIYRDGGYPTDKLFEPWFYGSGLPITEAYWSYVKVGGTPKLLLWQCFERRCLTYTPTNDPAWRVEMGNVGQHYYRWRYNPQGEHGIVTNVVDGDTIDVVIAGGETKRVRYVGINAPGAQECFGQQASAKNVELVLGKAVRLVQDVSETDSSGHLLRHVYVDGTFINDELVRRGYAYVSTTPPDVRHAAQFVEAQQEARDAGRGLWGACEHEPEPGCVNINTAPYDDLLRIVHIGPERAEQIIQLRPFASLDDLTRVSGIGPARLQDIKNEGVACV
jgi:endonuclease YncB( thermonuclease family)